ncbi:Leghemoglobin reductase [Capsicum annuum]|nr:Leghemoglobin reductase [Capsicum annuum]
MGCGAADGAAPPLTRDRGFDPGGEEAMLGSGLSSSGEKRQPPQGGSESEKRQKGECKGGRIKKFANEEDYQQYIKQGNGFARGYLPRNFRKADSLEDIDLPDGAPPEYHYHFADIWAVFLRQIYLTNGMDLDTYPGPTDTCDIWPLDLTSPRGENYVIASKDLADLAIKKYNDESNFYKYELLKIEKANQRQTGYTEFFMTVKVRNVTLATVVETFQIHAAYQGTLSKEVLSCLPKGGAEEDGIAWLEVITGKEGHVDYDMVLGVVYTHPEVAYFGKTEEQVKALRVDYHVIAEKESDEILGVYVMSPNAGELIHEVVLALQYGTSSEDIAHPTMSEALKEAVVATSDKPIHMQAYVISSKEAFIKVYIFVYLLGDQSVKSFGSLTNDSLGKSIEANIDKWLKQNCISMHLAALALMFITIILAWLLVPQAMDLDTFPGPADTCAAWPLDLTAPCNKPELVHCKELADLAIKEYNDESNFHKYELLKIEKVNLRETASSEYFMTVKVKNLTLGTVIETFQIHADHRGIANGDGSITEWRWNERHLNSIPELYRCFTLIS